MPALTNNIVEQTFKQIVNEFLNRHGTITVAGSLGLVRDFFNNYKIEDVDPKEPDDDKLFFEYGIYDWQDGKGENFTVDIVRQFYVDDEDSLGSSQLHLMLYFDSSDFATIEANNKWSRDFENIDQWEKSVVDSEGFKATEGKQPNAFDIFSNETY